MSMAEQWLSIVEYARTFAVSDMTVRRRIKTGRLHAILREGKYFIPVNGESGSIDEPAILEMPPNSQSMKVFAAPLTHSKEQISAQESMRLGASHRGIPPQLNPSPQRFEGNLVDSQAFIQFCEHSVTKLNTIERHLQDIYQEKIKMLEAETRLKDQTISQLKEQIEDLQILVRLMEKPLKVSQKT